jgi:Cyclic nucleotide-binding domain/Ion channel
MLLLQLTKRQKWELVGLALGQGLIFLYLPLSFAYKLPLWPSAVLEVLLTVLNCQYFKKKLTQWDVPWSVLATVGQSHLNLIEYVSILSLLHVPISKRLWEGHRWLNNRQQIMAGVAVLMLITHSICCGWLLIQPPTNINNVVDKYIWGYYWTVTTLATVGYGDITPTTSLARCYAMGIMMIGISSFALIISHFSRLLVTRDSKLEAQKQKLKTLNEIFTRNDVPHPLRNEIFHVYQHILNSKNLEDEDKILGEVPLSLREELQIQMRVFSISKLHFFKGLDRACLELIAKKFEDKFFNSGEVIVNQGSMGQEMFVVHHGEVELWRSSALICKLGEGNVFGETALVKRQPRNAKVVASKFCHILILSDKAYLEISDQFPEFRRTVESISNQREIAS